MLTDSAPATAERAPMRAHRAGSPLGVYGIAERSVALRGLSWSFRAHGTDALMTQGRRVDNAAKAQPITESQACSVPNLATEHRGIAPGTEVSAQKCDAHHNLYIAADRDVD
ncbi:MAG: hypothetical protein WAV90_22160 [Gordonia amarae]